MGSFSAFLEMAVIHLIYIENRNVSPGWATGWLANLGRETPVSQT